MVPLENLGRVTITLDDRDHLALKLLALQKDEKLIVLIQEAMRQYLDRTGAYELSIRNGNDVPE
jgi:predicted transcriptional regulator